jgi:hypothetical protein
MTTVHDQDLSWCAWVAKAIECYPIARREWAAKTAHSEIIKRAHAAMEAGEIGDAAGMLGDLVAKQGGTKRLRESTDRSDRIAKASGLAQAGDIESCNEILSGLVEKQGWDESKHPRDHRGRFGSGSGETEAKPAPAEPRIVLSRAMQEAQLKREWQQHGAEKDFDEVWNTDAGDRAWKILVNSHNAKHGTNYDPDNIPHNSATAPIFDAFEAQFLTGYKAKFPGVQAANDYHLEEGHPERAIFTSRKEADEHNFDEYGFTKRLLAKRDQLLAMRDKLRAMRKAAPTAIKATGGITIATRLTKAELHRKRILLDRLDQLKAKRDSKLDPRRNRAPKVRYEHDRPASTHSQV